MLSKLSFFSKTCMKQPKFSLDFFPKKSVSTLQLWPLSCFRSHHKSEKKIAATVFLFYISTCRNSTCWHRACFCPTLPFYTGQHFLIKFGERFPKLEQLKSDHFIAKTFTISQTQSLFASLGLNRSTNSSLFKIGERF